MSVNTDTLWRRVASRDRTADGLFVYAVASTGVYCRPSCASRRPRRDRVEFFPSAAMAEARGYRACRRCAPDRDGAERSAPVSIVQTACRAIARAPSAGWTPRRLARVSQTSLVRLQRSFRVVLGLSPREYLAACRRRAFLDRVKEGRPVTAAIYEAGYASPSRVYGDAAPGMTPATYGKGGRGAHIGWLTGDSAVGRLLVAATRQGVCFVAIGGSQASLRAELTREFPHATIERRPSSALAPFLAAARRAVDGGPIPQELPTDVRGTAFQWRVWRALRRIPAGETRSYTQLAGDVGAPSAARAVARACASNPLTLIVPCHRVVGSDGSLRGYRWGTDKKAAILGRERQRR
jgi:AraC family transcriptional regulator of adaptative response/methylated-DNA-[protein]-cysteine methyltransferase